MATTYTLKMVGNILNENEDLHTALSPPKDTYSFAEGTSIPLSVTLQSGYTLAGWYYNLEGSDQYERILQSGESITYKMPASNVSIGYYARKNYTIQFDANGGSVSPTSKTIIEGYAITTPTATRVDGTTVRTIKFNANGGSTSKPSQNSSATVTYGSNGWYTEKNGGTWRADNGGSYTPTQSETLYNHWSIASTGTYSAITFPTTNECVRDGYTLLGFSSSSTATTATYGPGSSHIVSGTTWYAIWKKTIILTYNENNGSGILPENQNAIIYNTTTSASFTVDPNSQANLSRTGYTFLGWSTSSDATAASHSQGDVINISEDTTLYAVWKIKQYTIIASTYLRNSLEGTDTINSSCGSIIDENGNIFSSGTFDYGKTIEFTAEPALGYSFKGWENNSALSHRTITVPAYNLEIKAYFSTKTYSLTPYNQTQNSDIRLWIREINSDGTYSDWIQIPFEQEYGFDSVTTIQIIVEDGENYEFTNATISQNGAIVGIEGYQDYIISDSTILTIFSQPIPVSNKIFVGGKTNGLKTSGYIKDPNISIKEPIKSIWIGNQQIMGKSPTRDYPYIIDTLLGDTLYIGLYNSIEDWKNGAEMKTEVPYGAYYENTNIKKLRMFNNIKIINEYAFRECSLDSIQLSKNLETIKESAFYKTSDKLKRIFIPSLVSNIHPKWSTFGGHSNTIEKFMVDLNNLNYSSDSQGVLYNKEKTELILYPTGRSKPSYILPFIEGTINTDQCFTNSKLKDIYYKGTKDQWNNLINCIQPDTGLPITVHCVDGDFIIHY